MLLMASLNFHLDALAWLVWVPSFRSSLPSLSVRTPLATSLLMRASADGACALAERTMEASAVIASRVQGAVRFIALVCCVSFHGRKVADECDEMGSVLLRLGYNVMRASAGAAGRE